MARPSLGGLPKTPRRQTASKKVNAIIRDIERGGYEGIGKPEPLKDNLSGYWSRRIDDYNRIVYKIDGEVVEIVQCCIHYHQ